MNRCVIIGLVLFCVLCVTASSTHAAEPNRQRLLMNMNWKFNLGDVQGAETPAFNDTACAVSTCRTIMELKAR